MRLLRLEQPHDFSFPYAGIIRIRLMGIFSGLIILRNHPIKKLHFNSFKNNAKTGQAISFKFS